MYAQLTYFDGPRTPEQLAAADFAGRERILPAVSKLGHSFRVYLLQRHDGSEVVVSIAILVATIAVVAVVASRMYAAGVLLYGQRPGFRAFLTAARRA